jgi:hypothetical protein
MPACLVKPFGKLKLVANEVQQMPGLSAPLGLNYTGGDTVTAAFPLSSGGAEVFHFSCWSRSTCRHGQHARQQYGESARRLREGGDRRRPALGADTNQIKYILLVTYMSPQICGQLLDPGRPPALDPGRPNWWTKDRSFATPGAS